MQIPSSRARPIAGILPGEFGTLADDYLVATRAPAVLKGLVKGHESHYDPALAKIVAAAPFHHAGADETRVALPPRAPITRTFDEVIARRASGRAFAQTPLPAAALATLLIFGNGVSQVAAAGTDRATYRRSAASAGNLASIEIFPIVLNVADVAPGIYHFDSVDHDLARLHDGHFTEWLRERVLHQEEFAGAAVALVLTCAFGRLRAKYGERCLRFGFLDAGHISENIYLAGAGLGVQLCATAGFVDAELDAALGLDGVDVAPVLVLLAGMPPTT